MMEYMYDSVTLDGIPRDGIRGQKIAFYMNGRYAAGNTVQTLFPPAEYRQIGIDVNGTDPRNCRVLDVETGDASPDQAEQWLTEFNEHNPSYPGGGRGTIYCNRSTISAVRYGTGKYRLGKDYVLWIATGDGTLYQGTGVVACQTDWYRLYDRSVVLNPHWMAGPGRYDARATRRRQRTLTWYPSEGPLSSGLYVAQASVPGVLP